MIVPDEILMSKIYFIRGQKVILDSDLAELYQVETKALKQAVKRNEDIFPLHFMFELTVEEFEVLRSQNVTSKNGRGGTRYLPYVFTEYGILQAANILRSARAKQMSIRIIEVFVRLHKMIIDNLEIRSLIEKLDKKPRIMPRILKLYLSISMNYWKRIRRIMKGPQSVLKSQEVANN
jgi:hypothetical protein